MRQQARQEGAIKFELEHRTTELERRRYDEIAAKLIAWRKVLALTRLVGQDPTRYEGAGYGNVSGRVGPPSAALGHRAFLITASQTSGLAAIDLDHFAVVDRYDIRRNRIVSHGRLHPSSESMTHAAVYDLGPHIRCVFHVHSPVLWRMARRLRIPTTDPHASYGTPEMACEVQRLFRESPVVERQILAMGGHEDGLLTFGRSPQEAGQILIAELARAYETEHRTGV